MNDNRKKEKKTRDENETWIEGLPSTRRTVEREPCVNTIYKEAVEQTEGIKKPCGKTGEKGDRLRRQTKGWRGVKEET